MLKSYLIIALRSLLTQRLYSAINVFGLAIGLASCILMSLFVFSEMGFDTYHAKSDNIIRVVTDLHPPGSTEQRFTTSQYKTGEAFVQEFAELTAYTRFRNVGTSMGTQQRMFNENLVYVVDANVFDLFSFEAFSGDLTKALTRPNTVVLTESTAQRLLGSTNVLGQTLMAGSDIALEVTAVIKDLPENTHLAINALVSWGTMGQMLGDEGWEENPSFNYYTYFETAKGTDVEALEAKIPAYMEEKVREGISDVFTLKLQRITDIYLTSKQAFEMKANGDINTVYAFSTIAILILLIACINFMNLSTARATKRAKEVGVRKVMGAYKSHLVMQFLGEALLISFLSMAIACGVVEAILPTFSQFIGKELTFNYITDFSTALSLVSVAVVVGIISGSYPAFYLSAFNPAKVLKGELTRGKSGAWLRKSLVIFQFSIAIMLMIATTITYLQLSYARNIDLGYNKENIVLLDRVNTQGGAGNWQVLKNKLLAHPQITGVAGSSLHPTELLVDSYQLLHPISQEIIQMPIIVVSHDYFDVYDIEFIGGRPFAPEYGADEFSHPTEQQPFKNVGVIVNQAAVKSLGWQDNEALGKQLRMPFDNEGKQALTATIVGVVKDHHFSSLHEQIKPTYHVYYPERFANMSIKFEGNVSTVSQHINEVWQQVMPNQPIIMDYMDDEFNAMYTEEDRQMTMFNLFSALAIFIACLGLFGLASFTTERRTKEIGIRKVIGASVMDIVVLLSMEFSKLVLLANVIAWPIAWYVMSNWLTNFVYRIDMNPMIFVASALVAFVIAWVTVGSLASVAAHTRPIKSLRYE